VTRIVVLGLDGLSPELMKRWLVTLPNLKEMQQAGVWGEIESTMPPAAAPAWTSVQCGRNPGAYGFWNYTYRDDFSYGEPKFVNSQVIEERVDCLYKILPTMGQKAALINVPVSYPPPQIPGGYCITGFMNSRREGGLTWPESLKDEVHNLVGEYLLDIAKAGVDYHLMDKDKVLKRIYDMDTQRFMLLKHFIHEKKCDYIFAVISGSNYMSHIFYRYVDKEHRRYDPDPRYQNALRDYYIWIDKNIGELRAALDSDTALLVLSAYSLQRCDGRINLNEWLIQEGYMILYEYPSQPTELKDLKVDWTNTKAWSTGDSSRIYLNLRSRETQGVVDPNDYDRLLDELIDRLQSIADENGKALNTQVFRRDDIHYGPYAEYGPDLFIRFNGHHWNTSELVGYGQGSIHSFDTKEAPHDESHGLYGYFCMAGPGAPPKGELKGVSLLSIAPTVLDLMELKIPEDMEGPSILEVAREKKETKHPAKDEEAVRSRLDLLGY